MKIEVRTLRSAVHSGLFGGLVPDALMAMSRLLASLHDDRGNVAVKGLVSEEIEQSLEFPEELAASQTGKVSGVEFIGDGSIASRLWTRPAISIVALDAPPVAEAINQLVPVARAKVSMRIPPGQDSAEALEALKSHLEANVPWGAELVFIYEESGEATTLDTDNWAVDAWKEAFREAYETETVEMGVGGSIPFIATFEELFPDLSLIHI